MNTESIVFLVLAFFVALFSVLSVTTKRIIRAATYLLFVLFGTAGLYFLLGYTFLGAVQIMVYAGGIVVLYIFAIMLTGKTGDAKQHTLTVGKRAAALVAALVGAGLLMFVIITHQFVSQQLGADITNESAAPISQIGSSLLNAGEEGNLLPFEAVSVLLLACIIGGLIIARKR
ncbi:MAG: NADH-quinone oxidoreductase subunit J [Bacteroidaceae bacterium]|jgi:NADH-quinone oxidoreductase subunit J|nr:NADH-quinone oxidoreductase subunit J [Bacteroidaceae bacterium]MBR4649875.1 NADH-quinone oxidoreductase subunit J [Bacteroidaceae bacterium]MBR6714758.1 NADH-quinone oxidoreductase subunit J [Bacteroidaceae bacterium]